MEVETAGAVGIHLGASYSSVGVSRDDKVEIIANDLGKKTTPTYIAFKDHPRKYRVETVIGEGAQEHVMILGGNIDS